MSQILDVVSPCTHHVDVDGNGIRGSNNGSDPDVSGETPDVTPRTKVDDVRVSSRGRRIFSRKDTSSLTAEYNLRQSSITNRRRSEVNRNAPKQPKSKTKPAPLSKYRRRAANARERDRMQEINKAFESLQNVIPGMEPVIGQSSPKPESYKDEHSKVTKITTLRLAMNYITTLRDILSRDASHDRNSSVSNDSSEFPNLSSTESILDDISLRFSSDDTEFIFSDSCSDEHGFLDSEGETWRN